MTVLQSTILTAIQRHGPQSGMALWHQTKCQPLSAVLVAIGELSDSGHIEKSYANRGYWQLTEKGRAAGDQMQQEVRLGSK
jgi:predicted transcriptional regulator